MYYKIIVVALLFSVLIYCTNPFSTRDPETPDSGSNVYENTTEPKIVLQNMIMAIQEKNINEYKKVFINADDGGTSDEHHFSFEPEPSLSDHFIDQWTVDDEESYFRNLVNISGGNYPLLNLSFNVSAYSFTPIIIGSQNDSVRTSNMKYTFTVNSGDSIFVYTGNSEFKLYRSDADNFWYIYYWRDNAINQNYNETWTSLKLKHY